MNNTHPSNLKVRRLSDLPEIPQDEIGESVLYATANNKDYKVGTTTYVDAVVEQLGDELAGIGEVRDEAVEARNEAVGAADAAQDAADAASQSADAAAASEATASDKADEAAASAVLAEQASLLGATIGFATKADMDGSLAHPAGTLALVTNDADPDNNGTYRKTGASGSGSWVQSEDRVTGLEVEIGQVETSLSARMRLGRAEVTGSATLHSRSSGNCYVTTREGSLYLEGGGGSRSAAIAAVPVPVTIPPGYALVVDFEGGQTDGSGAYIPEVVNVSSAASPDWQAGQGYILIGQDASGVMFGAYAVNPALGPFDGEAAVPTSGTSPPPEWDAQTRTLSWPQMLIAVRTAEGGNPNLPPRIVLSAGSVVVPDGQLMIVYLDLSQVVQSGTPSSAVVAMAYTAGPRMEPGAYLPLFCVGRSMAYPMRFPPTLGSTTWPRPEPRDGEVVLTAEHGSRFNLYVHMPLPHQPGYYMRWGFQHHSGVTPNGMPFDCWQVTGGALATLSGGISTVVSEVVDSGQAEYAISKAGDGGAFNIGGRGHGNDLMTNIVFLMDGSEVDPESIVGEQVSCRRLEIVQHSNVLDIDATTKVADRTGRWVFEGMDLLMSNRLSFVAPLATHLHYAPMLSAIRVSGSVQVTDRAMRSPGWDVEDVSGEYPRINTPSSYVKIWGQDSGFSAEVEVLEGWGEDSQMWLSSGLSRNKFYFEVDGPAPSYAPGDVSFYSARIRISHR